MPKYLTKSTGFSQWIVGLSGTTPRCSAGQAKLEILKKPRPSGCGVSFDFPLFLRYNITKVIFFMPRSIEQQPKANKEQSPRLELLSRWPNIVESLRENKIFESLAPELQMPPESFTSPEMLTAIDRHLLNKIDSFNSALQDLGMAEQQINNQALETPLALMMRLTPLALTLLEKEQQVNKEDARSKEEKSSEVLSGVAEQYDYSGLDNLVAEARITGKPEKYHEEGGAPQEAQELPGQLRFSARKKVLVDMYVQGKALNQLGHMYAYYAGIEKKQHAPYRALADCLNLLNTATVFLMAEQAGGGMAGQLNAGMESQSLRLGRAELRKNSQGEFQMYAWGMTAAELSHEISKGLLEYAVLDTSLPEAGTLSAKEATQLKSYLERPAIEMLELVYGAPLAKAVDQSISAWLKEIRAQHPSVRGEAISRIAKTLRVSEQDMASGKQDRNLSLRLFKVISGLPEEKLTEFYQHALKVRLPIDYWKQL